MKYCSGDGKKKRDCEEKRPAAHTAEPLSNTEKELKVEKGANRGRAKGQKWKRSKKR